MVVAYIYPACMWKNVLPGLDETFAHSLLIKFAASRAFLISTIVQPGEASAQDGALFQGQLQGAAQAGSLA